MSGSTEPPHLPVVVDEAGDSPRWVPLLGLAILCALALLVAARQAIGHDEKAETAIAADGGTAAQPSEKPAAQ